MHAIVVTHASTCTTSLMHVKNSKHHFCLWYLFSGTLEWRKWRNKNIKLNCWSVFLNLFHFSLTWMLYFHVWLQTKGKILIWRECYHQFSGNPHSHIFHLELWQNNLSNPEAYSEPCQTSKMECFAKIVNG